TQVTVRVRTQHDPSLVFGERRRVVREWEDEFDQVAAMTGLGLEDLQPRHYAGAREVSIENAASSGGKGFAPTSVPSVEGSPVQYPIITNTAMASQLQRLADWRTRTGVPSIVRTTEFIQANYPYGFDMQDRLRRFIRDAYQQWGITHVLLAGDTDIL